MSMLAVNPDLCYAFVNGFAKCELMAECFSCRCVYVCVGVYACSFKHTQMTPQCPLNKSADDNSNVDVDAWSMVVGDTVMTIMMNSG